MLSSGAALGPVLARDHLIDIQAARALTTAPPAAPLLTPRLPGSWAHGLWGRFHRKGQALGDCRVFSVKPPAPSAKLCVLLSPEQNVNQHLKAKGIEYLSYP